MIQMKDGNITRQRIQDSRSGYICDFKLYSSYLGLGPIDNCVERKSVRSNQSSVYIRARRRIIFHPFLLLTFGGPVFVAKGNKPDELNFSPYYTDE